MTAVGAGILLLLPGCSLFADPAYAQPYTEDVANWRQYLGVAIAIQVLLLAWALWSSGRKRQMSRMFLAFLLIPLLWTKLGEWLYRLGEWVLEFGLAGKLIAIFLSIAGGIGGIANVHAYFLGAFIFNDTTFLLYWALPGVGASLAAALFLLARGRKK